MRASGLLACSHALLISLSPCVGESEGFLKTVGQGVCWCGTEAVPKRILDAMNVEGLTRENVASHLQVWHAAVMAL